LRLFLHYRDNEVAQLSVESNSLPSKTKFLMDGTVLSCSTDKWAAPVPRTSEKNDCISFSEDRKHYTYIGRLLLVFLLHADF
jgi:hypothetical protein